MFKAGDFLIAKTDSNSMGYIESMQSDKATVVVVSSDFNSEGLSVIVTMDWLKNFYDVVGNEVVASKHKCNCALIEVLSNGCKCGGI